MFKQSPIYLLWTIPPHCKVDKNCSKVQFLKRKQLKKTTPPPPWKKTKPTNKTKNKPHPSKTQNPKGHMMWMSGSTYSAMCKHELSSDFINTLYLSFLPLLSLPLAFLLGYISHPGTMLNGATEKGLMFPHTFPKVLMAESITLGLVQPLHLITNKTSVIYSTTIQIQFMPF